MRFLKKARAWVKDIERHHNMTSKINLNDEYVLLNDWGFLTKQWDDGTGNLNKEHSKMGFKEVYKLGYRRKKLD